MRIDLRVDRGHFPPHDRVGLSEVKAGAQVEVDSGRRRAAPEWFKEVSPRLFIQLVAFDVLDQADNFVPGAADTNSTANRILAISNCRACSVIFASLRRRRITSRD